MRQGNGKCQRCGDVRGIAWSEFLKKSICLDCAIKMLQQVGALTVKQNELLEKVNQFISGGD